MTCNLYQICCKKLLDDHFCKDWNRKVKELLQRKTNCGKFGLCWFKENEEDKRKVIGAVNNCVNIVIFVSAEVSLPCVAALIPSVSITECNVFMVVHFVLAVFICSNVGTRSEVVCFLFVVFKCIPKMYLIFGQKSDLEMSCIKIGNIYFCNLYGFCVNQCCALQTEDVSSSVFVCVICVCIYVMYI